MTALGKVLVFFVLLFSVITGGMVAMSYVVRTNWRLGYEDAQKQLNALGAAQQAERDAFKQKREDLEKALAQRDQTIEAQKKDILGKATEIAALEKKAVDYDKKAKTEQANNAAATIQITALSNERDQMKDQLTERNGIVLKLQKDIVTATNNETQAVILANRLRDERENLMLKLEVASRQLNDLKQRGIQLPQSTLKPPTPELKGTVKGVEGSIAETTLGKDHGINVGDELQVYRTTPSPLYLGTLRISIAREHESVGTFTPANKTAAIRKGDTVDTKVLRGSSN